MACAAEQGPATTTAAGGDAIRFEIGTRALGPIDKRLFGQFMERPSWGETGPEAAVVPGTHDLQPHVVRLLEAMNLSIVRFPGGTDVDYMNWCDMVDRVPGRAGERPVSMGHRGHEVTNRFGLDEYLRLAERLAWETILVVNLRDGLLGRRPLEEAALHAAGLVAYGNGSVGAPLPPGMPDWPSLRAANGHAKPYGIRYVQLGNETWAFMEEVKAAHPGRHAEAYAECVAAYERAIHAVDPAVRLIMDYDPDITPLVRERLGDRIAFLCAHFYTPWMMRTVVRDGVEVPARELSAADIWHAWVSAPGVDDRGLALVAADVLEAAPGLGYKVAVTEWNWNGGWPHEVEDVALMTSSLARGLGAAGFLHAFMRRAGLIEIGTQSMLVGKGWGIAGIRVDESGKRPPYMRPSAMVTMLYARHHGAQLLDMAASGVPAYAQPLRMGGIGPSRNVALIDAVATGDGRGVYWHAINRSYGRTLDVVVDGSRAGLSDGPVSVHMLEGPIDGGDTEGVPAARIRTRPAALRKGCVALALPARSVTVLEAPRA